jgi:glyoxylase-like metal-dependent hydrolase (beta-lactamase superfamily II)
VESIIVLDVEYKFEANVGVIHPVILKDDNEMILVDCGYSGFMPLIEAAIKAKNLDCNQLTKIIITHHDHDHMGALADFKQKYPNIQIVASDIEAPYIAGEKKSLRLEQAEAIQATLSEKQKPYGRAFCEILRSVKPAKVDILVHDGEVMDWCGGCEIVGTPGHTPGHISLYLRSKRTLITGDAAALDNNELVIANPHFALDIEDARKSFAKLQDYNAEAYICYHGGVYRG